MESTRTNGTYDSVGETHGEARSAYQWYISYRYNDEESVSRNAHDPRSGSKPFGKNRP